MRIFLLSDFRFGRGSAPLMIGHRMRKAMIRAGHDVFDFPYRHLLQYRNPFKRRLGRWLGGQKTDDLVLSLMRQYKPELILIIEFALITGALVRRIREQWPTAPILSYYVDPLWVDTTVGATTSADPATLAKMVNPQALEIGRECDWFLATGAGEHLDIYRRAGIPRCAFMPNACDPDLERPYQVDETWQSDLLWTGKLAHSSIPSNDPMRASLVKRLSAERNLTVWGAMGRPKIYGLDYLYAISGANIGVHLNALNTVRMYHSDRLTNYVGCETFTLARYVPDSELLFKSGSELVYFNTEDECLDLIDYYSKHEAERKQIARRGRERAIKEFSLERIAGHIVNLATTGDYTADWKDIVS